MGYGQYSTQTRPANESRPREKQAKRLKHVFDNPAHVWAHPRTKDGQGFEQTDARVAQGNWYFKTSSDGTRVIYSYRDSYVIGSRFEHGKKTVFLLRSGKPYSVTTAGHMNATQAAVPKNENNVEVFTVPEMVDSWTGKKPGKAEHTKNLADYVERISELIERYGKARSSYNLKTTLGAAVSLTVEVKRYAKTFKLKLPALPKLPKLDANKLADIIKREQAREAKADAKRKADREAWEAQHKAEVEAWQNGPEGCKHLDSTGQPIHSYSDRYSCERQREREEWEATRVEKIAAWKRGENVTLRLSYSEPALLRVRTFGADESAAGLVGRVETSQGVQVPISGRLGAARLFRFLSDLKQTGRTFQTNGHKEHIGEFTVTSFDGNLLIAGCHKITWEEILTVSEAVLAADQTANPEAIA
jgi:hypothetical protein